jgi:hypothetical protein
MTRDKYRHSGTPFVWAIVAILAFAVLSPQAEAQTFNLFKPATGVLKGSSSTYVTTAATSSDIASLWAGTCSITTFLRGDGNCTQVSLTTNVTGTLPVANGGTGATSLTDLIALGTNTTGNYVATLTAGAGLTGTVSSEGATPTLAVGAGTGITVNADDVAINQAFSPTWTGAHVFTPATTGPTFNGSSANWAARFLNGNTAGNSYGILIDAGGNTSDSALRVRDRAGAGDYLHVRGDGQTQLIAGSAAIPSLIMGGDTDSGMYSGGSNVLAWSTLGVERMNLTASALAVSAADVTVGGQSVCLENGTNCGNGLNVAGYTCNGFSGTPTCVVYSHTNGNTTCLNWNISGTSNTTSLNVTGITGPLPGQNQANIARVQDNGTWAVGTASVSFSGGFAVLSFGTNVAGSATFTSSGTKASTGQLCYLH